MPDKEFRYRPHCGLFIFNMVDFDQFRRYEMLVNQQIVLDHDSKGTVHLYNTYDQTPAAEVAKMCTENGGGRARSKSGVEYRAMGFIPSEMWLYDPWLMMARKAQMAGDKGEYTKYLKKFFEVHREYAPLIPKKYY